jgi:hypothetical protein
MEEVKQLITLGGDMPDPFTPNPDDYEQHTLIGDCIRGIAGTVVSVHVNDLAILRANKLIAPSEAEAEAEAEPAKAKGKGKGGKATQPKAEIETEAEPEKAEIEAPAADLPAIPNIADMPGV